MTLHSLPAATERRAAPDFDSTLEASAPAEGAARDEAQATRLLAPSAWLREVCGFEAPFGFDGLPTVWG